MQNVKLYLESKKSETENMDTTEEENTSEETKVTKVQKKRGRPKKNQGNLNLNKVFIASQLSSQMQRQANTNAIRRRNDATVEGDETPEGE